VSVLSNGIDAHFPAHQIEIDITGVLDGFLQSNMAMPPGTPAAEATPVNHSSTSAKKRGVPVNCSCFQAGQCHHDFKNRTGGKSALRNPILKRVVRVFNQLFPLCRSDPRGKQIGIKGGAAGQNKHLAVSRVKRHDPARTSGEPLFGYSLEI
jgi:hypothetical protein